MKDYSFISVIECRNCNPNGDPLNDNIPRNDGRGHAEMSPVCIGHKLRVEAEFAKEKIFLTGSGADGHNCLNDRTQAAYPDFNKEKKQSLVAAQKKQAEALNKTFWDCRMFGFLVPSSNNGEKKALSIQMAQTVDPVDFRDIQITKCVGLEAPKAVEKKNANGDGEGEYNLTRSSDTMGMLHIIDFGLMVIRGRICGDFAEEHGVTEKDIELLKDCLVNMFEHDGCLARPAGSMMVRNVFWFEPENKRLMESKVYDAFHAEHKEGVDKPQRYQDYNIWVDDIPGVRCTDLTEG